MAKPKITAKNLQVLSELMDGEALAYKKCTAYATLCTDAALKTKLSTYASNHKARFDALNGYLNSHE